MLLLLLTIIIFINSLFSYRQQLKKTLALKERCNKNLQREDAEKVENDDFSNRLGCWR